MWAGPVYRLRNQKLVTLRSSDQMFYLFHLCIYHVTHASVLQAHLSIVLGGVAREAVRKICRVFRELYASVEVENEALRAELSCLENTPGASRMAKSAVKFSPAGETQGQRSNSHSAQKPGLKSHRKLIWFLLQMHPPCLWMSNQLLPLLLWLWSSSARRCTHQSQAKTI